MYVLYLKTPDQASLDTALENAGITEEGVPVDPRYLLDIIGTIHRATGETQTDELGFETPVMEPVEGFHANLAVRWPLAAHPDDAPEWLSSEAWEALEPLTLNAPNTPIRVWA